MNFITVSKSVRSVITTLILAYTLNSCDNKNSLIEETNTEAISFTTTITRGNPIERSDQLREVAIYAIEDNSPTTLFMDNVLLTKDDDDQWSYDPPHYWNEVETLSVYAYSPQADKREGISINSENNNLILTYNVPTNVTRQPDLLISEPILNQSSTETALPLLMKHALTAIAFAVSGSGEKITAIGARNIYTQADLNLKSSNIEWYNFSKTSTELYAGLNNDIIIAEDCEETATSNNGYLMMIPQTLPSGAEIFAIIDEEERIVDISNTQWIAGDIKIYELTITDKWFLADFSENNYPTGNVWTIYDEYADNQDKFNGLLEAIEDAEDNCIDDITIIFPLLTDLPGESFRGCTYLTKIIMPSVTVIKSNCFRDCINLSEVDLASIEEIGANSFRDCSSLTKITISYANGSKLSKIGTDAFPSTISEYTILTVTNIDDNIEIIDNTIKDIDYNNSYTFYQIIH